MGTDGTRIFLIRHGETEFNRMGVFRGRFEVELNDVGLQQARETAAALADKGIKFILTSPLKRAVVTAQVISEALGAEYQTDESFNNIDLGDWQGVPKKKVQEDYPEQWKQWTTRPEELVLPGGESVEDVRKRASGRLLEILEADRGDFALVTHRSVIKVLAADMLNVPPPYFWKFYIDNAAFSVFEYNSGDFTLLNWNSNSHLSVRVTEVF